MTEILMTEVWHAEVESSRALACIRVGQLTGAIKLALVTLRSVQELNISDPSHLRGIMLDMRETFERALGDDAPPNWPALAKIHEAEVTGDDGDALETVAGRR